MGWTPYLWPIDNHCEHGTGIRRNLRFLPIDDITLEYMRLSGRSEEQVELVNAYAKAQGMWRNPGDEPVFTSSLELDMGSVEASLAGPKRPQDRVALADVPKAFSASNELEVNSSLKDRQPVDYTMSGQQISCRTARW